jgi:tRNA threonylcarbamoyladenosine modification (KEOPS) complex  Pcc1 subunit
MYQSTIIVKKDIDQIYKLFASEDRELNRSRYSITKSKKELVFNIDADDATALKTAFNMITKVLSVWEKTKSITKKD